MILSIDHRFVALLQVSDKYDKFSEDNSSKTCYHIFTTWVIFVASFGKAIYHNFQGKSCKAAYY